MGDGNTRTLDPQVVCEIIEAWFVLIWFLVLTSYKANLFQLSLCKEQAKKEVANLKIEALKQLTSMQQMLQMRTEVNY